MTLIVFAGLFVPIMIFGLSVYFFRLSNRNLKLLVAFSGAFLLSLTFNKFVPHIYGGLFNEPAHEAHAPCSTDDLIHPHDHTHIHGEQCTTQQHVEEAKTAQEHEHHHGHSHAHGPAKIIGLFILLGFFIQLILDYLTKGVEHGHLHSKCPDQTQNGHNHAVHQGVAYWPVLLGLSLHSFLESMPLAKGFEEPSLQNHLLIGIIIHNIPISIVFMSLLIQHKVSKWLAIVLLAVFGLSGPAGVIATTIVGEHFVADMDMFFRFSMAIVVGIFLHI
ncbi:MAG TPA: ZIP family metal transporter, partial [Bacteroidales bacterium]|nr:ZIP family metal transporter [Bacteroidales bacterium]